MSSQMEKLIEWDKLAICFGGSTPRQNRQDYAIFIINSQKWHNIYFKYINIKHYYKL